MQINTALRDQLEEAHQTNEALTNDLQKLTTDWEQMREEMICKEEEWKEEEQVCVKSNAMLLYFVLTGIDGRV